MEPSFDLDINNYDINDLLKFFRLENDFSLEDLTKKEEELSLEILSSNNSDFNSKYKFDIINFIKSAKEVLYNFLGEMENLKEIKKNVEKIANKDKDPRVGKIINPLAPHQALEHSIIPENNINGYAYNITTSIYVFNTIARNDYFKTVPANSTFDLPVKWKDVISISLSSANIPNVMYAYNNDSGTNQIYIKEDGTGLSGIVTLPEGNYSPYVISVPSVSDISFSLTLEKEINEQILGITIPALYRFRVSIDLANRKTTISNTTNTFTMRTLDKDPNVRCSPFTNFINVDYNDFIPNKDRIQLTTYLETMGYLMGFRELEYSGQNSYTSESIFTNVYSNYLFFVLQDFITSARTSTSTYAILGEGVLDENILAVIPLNSNSFGITFDSNANFIYKKREYFGPVDISRINIRLVNQLGQIVNLHGTDFNFSLQVKTVYNLTEKTKFGMRGFF